MVQLLRPNFFNLDFAYARLLFAHSVHDTLGAEREYVRSYMHMYVRSRSVVSGLIQSTCGSYSLCGSKDCVLNIGTIGSSIALITHPNQRHLCSKYLANNHVIIFRFSIFVILAYTKRATCGYQRLKRRPYYGAFRAPELNL